MTQTVNTGVLSGELSSRVSCVGFSGLAVGSKHPVLSAVPHWHVEAQVNGSSHTALLRSPPDWRRAAPLEAEDLLSTCALSLGLCNQFHRDHGCFRETPREVSFFREPCYHNCKKLKDACVVTHTAQSNAHDEYSMWHPELQGWDPSILCRPC